VDWLVGVALVVVLLATYLSWTAGRVERLHARLDRARAALDLQLDRRAAAAARLAGTLPGRGPDGARERLRAAAQAALDAPPGQCEAAENDLTRALRLLPLPPDSPAAAEVRAAGERVALARQFYNDAVRDTLALRRRRVPRAFRIGARRALPGYFDIDTDLDAGAAAGSGPGPTPGGGTGGATGGGRSGGTGTGTGTGAGLSRSA